MSPAHNLSMFIGERRRGGIGELLAGGKLAILRSVVPGPGDALAGDPPELVIIGCIGCPCELRLKSPSTALDILSCSLLSGRSTLSDMLVGPRASEVTLVCIAGMGGKGSIAADDTVGG